MIFLKITIYNKLTQSESFFNGSYSEISVASYKDWTAKEIRERGLKMLDFLEERWSVDIADWEIEKIDLLNLNFEGKAE